MSGVLALDWRPKRLAEVTGQKHVRVVLGQMLKTKEMPSAMLFTGPRGTGKTTCGRIVAAALNAPDGLGDVNLESPHARAIQNSASPDVLEIDAASNGNVDDVRDLQKKLMYHTTGEWRVVLLDEAHSMSKEAFNALLKTLEEPPPNTLFILLTTEPNKILETVRSRCMTFEFRRVPPNDLIARLRYICAQEDIKVDDTLLADIAERSQGGMRDAIMLLDQARRVGVQTADQLATLFGEVDFAPAIIDSIMEGNIASALSLVNEQLLRTGDPGYILDEISDTIADSFIAGGETDRAATRHCLFERYGVALLKAGRPLWNLRSRAKLGSMESALRHSIMMACMVNAKVESKHVVKTEAVSLDSMKEMLDV